MNEKLSDKVFASDVDTIAHGGEKVPKENIARYEGMVNKEMSISRMKFEVLDQQVQTS